MFPYNLIIHLLYYGIRWQKYKKIPTLHHFSPHFFIFNAIFFNYSGFCSLDGDVLKLPLLMSKMLFLPTKDTFLPKK